MTGLARRVGLILAATIAVTATVEAGPSAADVASAKERVVAAIGAERWEEALEGLGVVLAADATDGGAWLQKGRALHALTRYDEAVEALAEASGHGATSPGRSVLLARCLARLEKYDQAFAALAEAAEGKYQNAAQMNEEPDFAGLRQDSRFEKALELVDRNARPCLYNPVYRQFDFWVGEWSVTSNGQPAGTNRIEKSLDSCALLENWTSRSGGTGKSINFYDPYAGKWRQVWADSSAGNFMFQGELRGGAMHFEGEYVTGDGTRTRSRMTFTPQVKGAVRQLIEQSTDGEQWSTWFDGYYTPIK